MIIPACYVSRTNAYRIYLFLNRLALNASMFSRNYQVWYNHYISYLFLFTVFIHNVKCLWLAVQLLLTWMLVTVKLKQMYYTLVILVTKMPVSILRGKDILLPIIILYEATSVQLKFPAITLNTPCSNCSTFISTLSTMFSM